MRTVQEGCPICSSDVRGNEESKFYCKKCNILYSPKNLKIRPKED